jgi:hypothetical protein
MKIRPANFSFHAFNLLFESATNYIGRGLIFGYYNPTSNELVSSVLNL